MEKLYVICSILGIGLVLSFVIILFLYNKLGKIQRNLRKIDEELAGENAEQLLLRSIYKQDAISHEIEVIKNDIEKLQEKQMHCFDKLSVVRYPTSSEIGPKLSYSVGLTNEAEDALIITGLHYRQGLQVYYKQVKEGISETELSDEEKSVIRRNKAEYVMKADIK